MNFLLSFIIEVLFEGIVGGVGHLIGKWRGARPKRRMASERNSALERVTADGRRAWVKGADAAVATGCVILVVGGMAWLGFTSDRRWERSAAFAVAETLELQGHAGARVKRQWFATHCRFNSLAYHWSAAGAQGRACANLYDGEVDVKVDRRWGAAPKPWRSAAPAPRPV